jgi:hypothetical protein
MRVFRRFRQQVAQLVHRTPLQVLVFAMAYSSCALNLSLGDSGLSPLMTSQENTPSTFLQESGQNRSLSDW